MKITARKPIMKITAHRANQIEATIRRLRNHPDLWGDDEVKSQRITSIIIKRKIALCDYYDEQDEILQEKDFSRRTHSKP